MNIFFYFYSPDGCIVPLGPSHDTGIHNPLGYTLNYNEFVVYSTEQVCLYVCMYICMYVIMYVVQVC